MTRDVPDLTRQTILRKYEEARAEKLPEMTADKKLFMKCTKTVKR